MNAANTYNRNAAAQSPSLAPRWLLGAAALLAVWMLVFFVQLLNESVHRGESLRQQQRLGGQPGTSSGARMALERSRVEALQSRVLVASQR